MVRTEVTAVMTGRRVDAAMPYPAGIPVSF